MLWLALRFPHLPLEAAGSRDGDSRFLVIEEQHRVCMATRCARQAGVEAGMKASGIHALAKAEIVARDRAAETQLLQNLAAWAYDFTPYIEVYGDNCLLLEISRCLRLFGGVENLCTTLRSALSHKNRDYRTGLAHSRQGAWLLSHQTYPVRKEDNTAVFMSRIHSMPLTHLHLSDFPDVADKLHAMGFQCFGDLSGIPPAELGKRFGQEFLNWLSELEGRRPAVLMHNQPAQAFQRSISFHYAVDNTRLLEAPAEKLLQELMDFLVRQQLETRQIDWCLYSPQGQVHSFSLGAGRIHSQKDLLMELTRVRLEQIRLVFPVERLELHCEQTTAFEARPLPLFQDQAEDRQQHLQQDAEALTARIQTRLGPRAIYQFEPRSEHLPEQQAVQAQPFKKHSSREKTGQYASHAGKAPRPVWLFKQPRRIQRHGTQLCWSRGRSPEGKLQLIQGPERIEGTWWQQNCTEATCIRDYFIAERDDQVRYWIYHDLHSDHWYAQGIFS